MSDDPSGTTPRGPAGEIASFARGVAVLAVVVVAVAGLLGMCSFSPGTPEVDRSTLPRVDPTAALRSASAGVGFDLRVPQLPPEWISQSSDVVPLGPGSDPTVPRAVRVGWVTPENRYARLVQSDGDVPALVAVERGEPVDVAPGAPTPQGTVAAAGREWTTYATIRQEQAWITEVDGVRLLVTGDAGPAELTRLAEAALAAPPSLPGGLRR